MEAEDLVIIEDGFSMSLETILPAHPPPSYVSRSPTAGGLAPQLPSSHTPRETSHRTWPCEGCDPQDAQGSLPHHQRHSHLSPAANDTRHLNLVSDAGTVCLPRARHINPVASELRYEQTLPAVSASPLSELPHRVRPASSVNPNEAPEFFPPVSREYKPEC
jgi:hypothetical protein